jgi:hypothetical protein
MHRQQNLHTKPEAKPGVSECSILSAPYMVLIVYYREDIELVLVYINTGGIKQQTFETHTRQPSYYNQSVLQKKYYYQSVLRQTTITSQSSENYYNQSILRQTTITSQS